MANRVVKEGILKSDKVNSLSWTAEVFYRRLMSVADDYGRFDARLPIVRSSLYPLRLDRVSEADIIKWMDECSEAGLISQYEVDNKPYMEIIEFGQTLRIKKSKYPCSQMQADENNCMSEKKPNPKQETESENLITIGHDKFFNRLLSSILKNEYRTVLDQHMAGILKNFDREKILQQADLEYPNYNFKDTNHLSNSVKGLGEKILKGQNKKTNGTVTSAVTKY